MTPALPSSSFSTIILIPVSLDDVDRVYPIQDISHKWWRISTISNRWLNRWRTPSDKRLVSVWLDDDAIFLESWKDKFNIPRKDGILTKRRLQSVNHRQCSGHQVRFNCVMSLTRVLSWTFTQVKDMYAARLSPACHDETAIRSWQALRKDPSPGSMAN